eukprot:TRINITY_DN8413_c0_g1_i3.p1 TRINITY_DN8413_c0_g1~~TRINITY_DN8413_c0_g1_i3.p1  ORF type:complete len:1123 (+),score=226.57 TRINITY_DN8413_c0_g1_i3:105-3473(+)
MASESLSRGRIRDIERERSKDPALSISCQRLTPSSMASNANPTETPLRATSFVRPSPILTNVPNANRTSPHSNSASRPSSAFSISSSRSSVSLGQSRSKTPTIRNTFSNYPVNQSTKSSIVKSESCLSVSSVDPIRSASITSEYISLLLTADNQSKSSRPSSALSHSSKSFQRPFTPTHEIEDSQVPLGHHVVDNVILPLPEHDGYDVSFIEDDSRFQVTLFPSRRPIGKKDVVLLESWVDYMTTFDEDVIELTQQIKNERKQPQATLSSEIQLPLRLDDFRIPAISSELFELLKKKQTGDDRPRSAGSQHINARSPKKQSSTAKSATSSSRWSGTSVSSRENEDKTFDILAPVDPIELLKKLKEHESKLEQVVAETRSGDDQVPDMNADVCLDVLSVAFSEVTRQISQFSIAHGRILSKLWHSCIDKVYSVFKALYFVQKICSRVRKAVEDLTSQNRLLIRQVQYLHDLLEHRVHENTKMSDRLAFLEEKCATYDDMTTHLKSKYQAELEESDRRRIIELEQAYKSFDEQLQMAIKMKQSEFREFLDNFETSDASDSTDSDEEDFDDSSSSASHRKQDVTGSPLSDYQKTAQKFRNARRKMAARKERKSKPRTRQSSLFQQPISEVDASALQELSQQLLVSPEGQIVISEQVYEGDEIQIPANVVSGDEDPMGASYPDSDGSGHQNEDSPQSKSSRRRASVSRESQNRDLQGLSVPKSPITSTSSSPLSHHQAGSALKKISFLQSLAADLKNVDESIVIRRNEKGMISQMFVKSLCKETQTEDYDGPLAQGSEHGLDYQGDPQDLREMVLNKALDPLGNRLLKRRSGLGRRRSSAIQPPEQLSRSNSRRSISSFLHIPKPFDHLVLTLKANYVPRPKPPKALAKILNSILLDKIAADSVDDRENTPRQNLVEFVYDFFLNKYGLRSAADENLTDFVMGLKSIPNPSHRFLDFMQMIGFTDNQPLPLEAINLYLQPFIYIKSKLGPRVNIMEVKFISPQLARDTVFSILIPGEDSKFRDAIATKVAEESTPDNIDMDTFTHIIFGQWLISDKEEKKLLELLFQAADINRDAVLCFEEFLAAVRAIDFNVSTRQVLSNRKILFHQFGIFFHVQVFINKETCFI